MIGFFDSGVGGLSILKETRKVLPNEDFLYVADQKFNPYGKKSIDFLKTRAEALTRFLVEKGARLVVVACNTATAAAIDHLRKRFKVPIVGVEPGVKPAAESTERGRIAVLSTPMTAISSKFKDLIERESGEIEVIVRPCPDFVELVENGTIKGPKIDVVVQEKVAPLVDVEEVDTIVLGCTHFNFLAKAIRSAVGDEVKVVDVSSAVAKRIKDLAGQESEENGKTEIITTGDPESLRKFVGEAIPNLQGNFKFIEIE